MFRVIVSFGLITSAFAGESLNPLVSASRGFSTAIQQQILAIQRGPSLIEFVAKTIYVDEQANQGRQDALTQIFSGQAGGHLAGLAPLVGEVLGVKAAPIEYRFRWNTTQLAS